MQGAYRCYPEKIFTAPLWDNPLFLRNNRSLKRTYFPLLSHSVTCMADFYFPNTCTPKTRDDLESTHNCIVDQDTFTDLKYIMNMHLDLLDYQSLLYFPQYILINLSLSMLLTLQKKAAADIIIYCDIRLIVRQIYLCVKKDGIKNSIAL